MGIIYHSERPAPENPQPVTVPVRKGKEKAVEIVKEEVKDAD